MSVAHTPLTPLPIDYFSIYSHSPSTYPTLPVSLLLFTHLHVLLGFLL